MKGIRGLAEAISEWAGGGDAGVPAPAQDWPAPNTTPAMAGSAARSR